jgi:broad specificity phosphatase PhoE
MRATPSSSGRDRELAAVARTHLAAWTSAAQAVDDGETALVVGHGGAIEPTLVACLPDADQQRWGGLLGHCDGARLAFEHGAFVGIQFRRAPATPPH